MLDDPLNFLVSMQLFLNPYMFYKLYGWTPILLCCPKIKIDAWEHLTFFVQLYRMEELHWIEAYVSEGISNHMILQSLSKLFLEIEIFDFVQA